MVGYAIADPPYANKGKAMNVSKITFYCLLIIWQPTKAIEYNAAITATTQWMINTHNGNTQAFNVTLQPELEASFNNGWKIQSEFRLRAEATNGMQINDLNRNSYADFSKPIQLNREVELELRELTLQGSIGDTFLTLGKQQIVWGKADGLHVFDIVNPQSFREFILDDFDNSRIPLPRYGQSI